MNLENSHYDAFISYRHSELDKFVAENLHRELEALKLPRKLIKEGKGNGKKRITRVFRDKEELPLASDLAEPITNALKNAEYLIVICSPRLPESIWCRREVETFVAMHGRERVFAVLVEGRAHESFPDAILWDEQTITAPDGTTKVERIAVEPFAADVRGKNKREVKKRLKEEVLRLAAPMFDVSFDDLRQRHHERKVKRILTAAITFSSVFLTFGAVSTAMAWHIQKQSDQIAEQNTQIETQYWEALTRESELTAKQTTEELNQGRRVEAVQNLLSVLPESLEEQDKPYTAAAEYALAEATWAYQNGRVYKPSRQIALNAIVGYVKMSPDGNRLLASDSDKNISVYDVKTGELLAFLTTDNSYISAGEENRTCFITDDIIAYYSDNNIILYDISKSEAIQTWEAGMFTPYLYAGGNGKFLAACEQDTLRVYDVASGAVLYEVNMTEETDIENIVLFSNGIQRMHYVEVPAYGNDATNSCMVTLDMNTWKVLSRINLDGNVINDMCENDGVVYLTSYSLLDDVFAEMPSFMMAIDYTAEKILWKLESQWGTFDEICAAFDWQNKMFAIQTYDEMIFVDEEDGHVISTFSAGEEIVTAGITEGKEGCFLVITETGSLVGCFPETDYAYTLTWIDFHASDITYFYIVNRQCIQAERKSMNIVIYDIAESPGISEFYEFEDSVVSVKVNKEQNRLLVVTRGENSKNKWYLFDFATKEIINQGDCLAYDSVMDFVGDGSTYFAEINHEIRLHSVQDGTEMQTIPLLDEIGEEQRFGLSEVVVLQEGKFIVGNDYYSLYIYDLENGKLQKKSRDITELRDSNKSIYAISDNVKYYAVVSGTDQEIRVYGIGNDSLKQSIPVKAGFVYKLAFSADSSKVVVVYEDASLEVYDIESGERSAVLDLDTKIEQVDIISGSTDMILKANGVAYLVNEQFQVKACIEDYVGVDPTAPAVYVAYSKELKSIPLYSYDELIQFGQEIVNQ